MAAHCVRRAMYCGVLALITAFYPQVVAAEVQDAATAANASHAAIPAAQQRFQNYKGYYRMPPQLNYPSYGYPVPYAIRPGYRAVEPVYPYDPYRYYGYPRARRPYWYSEAPYGTFPYWYYF